MARKPITFSVGSAIDPEIAFNREVALDTIYLNGRPVLQVVDMDMHFQAASFFKSVSTEEVWDSIIRNRENTNAGLRESMLTDQGSKLMSSGFQERALHFGVDVRLTPIESRISNRLMERYHVPLQRTYEKNTYITEVLAIKFHFHMKFWLRIRHWDLKE
jgi:hypothetical protein